MAGICSCLQAFEGKINLYLKNHRGEFVPPKDVFNACTHNSGVRCGFKSECNAAIKDIVKKHNDSNVAANDDQGVASSTPDLPQFKHN